MFLELTAARYYAKSVLDHLHRSQALAVWEDVVNGDTVPLDRALGSFDLFVLHDQVGDLSEVWNELLFWGFHLLTSCIDIPNSRRPSCTT